VREGNELIGVGVAAAGYHTSRSEADAQVRINGDGTADVFSATCDMGPGTYTSLTQVAADALGLPLPRVRFSLGDSRFPKAPSHSGSRTMASVGSAVFIASNTLRDKFIPTAVVDPASPLSGAAPQNVMVTDGRMYRTDDPTRGETYQDLLRRRGWPSLDTQQTWTPDDADKRFSMYAYGAVSPRSASTNRLAAYGSGGSSGVTTLDGSSTHRRAHSQAIGAMVMGIGMALLEARSWTTATAAWSTPTCRTTWRRSTRTCPRWMPYSCPGSRC
jgi:xanthine dehydrogenase YagR molybdenum-binding subunit